MLNEGIIVPAQSEWASLFLLVPKPDKKTRFCVDYHQLNARKIKDRYSLPRMNKFIDSLGDASCFTTIDANWGYW